MFTYVCYAFDFIETKILGGPDLHEFAKADIKLLNPSLRVHYCNIQTSFSHGFLMTIMCRYCLGYGVAVGSSSDRTLGTTEQEEQIHNCLFGSLFLINI